MTRAGTVRVVRRAAVWLGVAAGYGLVGQPHLPGWVSTIVWIALILTPIFPERSFDPRLTRRQSALGLVVLAVLGGAYAALVAPRAPSGVTIVVACCGAFVAICLLAASYRPPTDVRQHGDQRVTVNDVGPQWIQVAKIVREVGEDPWDDVRARPVPWDVAVGVSEAAADEIAGRLRRYGAQVQVSRVSST